MKDRDMTQYEAGLAVRHELECRHSAGLGCLPWICPIRKCRRDRGCTGPMVPTLRQDGVVRAQKAIGLSGKARACLPACAALGDDACFSRFEEGAARVRSALREHPEMKLHQFTRRLKGCGWR